MTNSDGTARLVPSFGQERRVRTVAAGTPADRPRAKTVPLVCELPDDVDTAALSAAVGLFVGRHAVLRQRFALDDRVTVHAVADGCAAEVECLVVHRSDAVHDYVREQVDRPFDVFGWPLVRTGVVLTERPLLHLAADHLVSDGHSVMVAMREIQDIHDALVAGRPVDLPRAGDFGRHSELQRERYADGPALDREVADLLGQLAGRPVEPPFPMAGEWDGTAGRYVELELLDEHGAAELARLCRDSRASLFMAVLAAFGIAAADVTGCADAGVLVATHNREEPADLNGVGWYANMLPLYFPPGDVPRFSDAVRTVRDRFMRLLPHYELPLCRVLDYLPTDPTAAPPAFMSFVDQRTPARPGPPRRWRQVDFAPAYRWGYGIWVVHRDSGLRAVVASPRPVGDGGRLAEFERRLAGVLREAVGR